MRVSVLSKLFCITLLLLAARGSAAADAVFDRAAKLLPDNVGAAAAQSTATPPGRSLVPQAQPQDYGVTATAQRSYRAPDGSQFGVQLVQTESDAAAYALLTALRRAAGGAAQSLSAVGPAAFSTPERIGFYRGAVFVTIDTAPTVDLTARLNFARELAATLADDAGELPPLATHLPDWPGVQPRASYAVSLAGLQAAAGQRPALDAVSFAGGTEATTAVYPAAGQLVVIEFTTPQLAGAADTSITQRLAELSAQNQPQPAFYKRVGNYVVFVFDAPDAQAAAQLAGQVKYEKVVQWLGEDPHRVERANRYWLNMSTSIIVNTVKVTGLAILLCLSVGALFGGVIFRRRRAQTALHAQFSDAGGMMRLNLDDLAASDVPAQLLPPREQ